MNAIPKRKRLLTVVIIISFISVSILSYTLVESKTEPMTLHPSSPFFDQQWSQYFDFPFYPLDKMSNLSISGKGNSVEIGYMLLPWGGQVGRTVNLSGWVPDIGLLRFQLWVRNITFSYPYNAFSIIPNSFSLVVNGSFLNVSKTGNYDILPYVMTGSGYNYDPSEYSWQCVIPTPGPDKNTMNTGNYSFNFSFVFTPVFEFGPYWTEGTQEEITYHWNQTIITKYS